jgi:hypothetical protein
MITRSRGSLLAGIATLTSVLVFFQACGGPDGSGLVMKSEEVRALDGQEMFRGLVLGRGAVAAHFPEIWGDLEARKKAMSEADSAVVVQRLAMTAAYMRGKSFPEASIARVEEAVRALESGSVSLEMSAVPEEMIENALLAAIEGADPTFFPRFKEAMSSGDRIHIAAMFQEAIARGSEAAPSLGYELAVDQDVALPIAIAIVAVVFIAVVLVCCDPCLPSQDAMSPLNREDYVDQIALRMSLQPR